MATHSQNAPISFQDAPGQTFHLCWPRCLTMSPECVLAHPGVFLAVILILCGYLPWLIAPWGLGKAAISSMVVFFLVLVGGGYRAGVGWGGGLVELCGMLYFLVAFVGSLYSINPWMSWVGVYTAHRSSMLDLALYGLLWGSVGRESRGSVLCGVLVGGLLNLIIAYFQMFGVSHMPMLMSDRLTGLTGSPLSLACVFGWLGVCFLEAGFPWWSLSLIVPAIFGTGSRAGICGAFMCWGLWWALRTGKWRILVLSFLLGAVMIAAVGFGRSSSLSDSGRGLIWRAAWSGFKASPVIGNGPATTLLIFDEHRDIAWQKVFLDESQEQAHNVFLEALCSLGLLGFLAYCLILVSVLFSVWEDPAALCCLLAIVPTALLNPLLIPIPAVIILIVSSCSEHGRPIRPMLSGLACCIVILGYSWFYVRDRRMRVFGGEYGDAWSTRSAIELGLIYTKTLLDKK